MTLVLSRSLVQQLLRIEDCIEALRPAHIAFSRGQAIMPARLGMRVQDGGLLGLMPAWVEDGPALGVKCITSYPGNAARGLPTINSTILLLDAATGVAQAILDGTYLTATRTAAASAIATDLLARPDVGHLALIGAGAQASSHLRAMVAVRPIRSVSVASRTLASAQRFVDRHAHEYEGVSFAAVRSGDEAVDGAEIVCTVSAAAEPVLSPGSLAPGAHVNAVGSHTPRTREIPGETMREARVVVDSREAALSECGDCIIPIAEGLFGPDHVSDELGEVLTGNKPGRTSDGQVTAYQSCGIAIQDVVTARLVYEKALAAGVGTEVELN